MSFDVKISFSIYAYLGNHGQFSMGLEILFYIDSSSPYNLTMMNEESRRHFVSFWRRNIQKG